MDQFMVPQFIDIENKVIGPISVRQFLILLATGGIIFVLYELFSFVIFAVFGTLILAFGGTLAFARISGQPFHIFLLNFIQTMKRPKLKVWQREIVISKAEEIKKIPPRFVPKKPVTRSRLAELSIAVDTGGVYQPEE